jgi:hypothetical protein
MTSYTTHQHTDRPGRLIVCIDHRLDLILIRGEDGLQIEVYPVTGGKPWDAPFERFAVSEADIREREAAMAP